MDAVICSLRARVPDEVHDEFSSVLPHYSTVLDKRMLVVFANIAMKQNRCFFFFTAVFALQTLKLAFLDAK
jgi:hypothetical protein